MGERSRVLDVAAPPKLLARLLDAYAEMRAYDARHKATDRGLAQVCAERGLDHDNLPDDLLNKLLNKLLDELNGR
jgi:hypothetical protein